MAWPTNKYQASKLVGMIGEEWVLDYLKQNRMSAEIVDVRKDKGWKEMDVDFTVTQFVALPDHWDQQQVTLIEVKTDQHTLKTDNFAFETKKEFANGDKVQGAWLRSRADEWWYVCATEGMDVVLYVLNAKLMRKIYTFEVLEKGFDEPKKPHKRDNGDKFWCRLVPVEHIPVGWRGYPRTILSADQLDERMAAIMEREGVK